MNKELQDFVWQKCLPKEFREEVKKRYLESASISDSLKRQYEEGITKNQYDLGVTNTYKNIFGEHNLTSDTKTEEMLIISRKAAEEFYDKYFGERLCEVNRSNLRKDITTLFGGKFGGGEDDIAVNKTKPKFKVGDKVKILSDGRTGTITNIKEFPASYFVIWDMTQGIAGGWLTESDIELYTDEKKKFLVGDKVTVPDWIVNTIKPSFIELQKRTHEGTIHIITINKNDILSFDKQLSTLHVGDKMDIPGWTIKAIKGNEIKLISKKMSYGRYDIIVEENDLAPYIEPKQENALFSESAENENNGSHIVTKNKHPDNQLERIINIIKNKD